MLHQSERPTEQSWCNQSTGVLTVLCSKKDFLGVAHHVISSVIECVIAWKVETFVRTSNVPIFILICVVKISDFSFRLIPEGSLRWPCEISNPIEVFVVPRTAHVFTSDQLVSTMPICHVIISVLRPLKWVNLWRAKLMWKRLLSKLKIQQPTISDIKRRCTPPSNSCFRNWFWLAIFGWKQA